ncbi:MAG: 50S ribosomal protein L25 [Opitutae bacterium]|jgi:large subunit ribosomal protein L25|nr:50S ribosomal protein L25 [Opitutae bacterium]MBT5717470.1 50S ribosomal protein L25 [Opitutae bacterium]
MSELSDLTIKVAPRDQTGRQACNKLRASGRIPAVLYGKEINKSVSLEDRSMRILLRKASGTSSLLRLLGEKGEDELVLIKDMQMHPIKNSIMHIDFVQVNRGEDLQTKIPLTLSGEAEGVKTEGGILEVLANEVEIRCRPSNLPSQIEIDISNLALGENLQIKDLPKLDGVEYVTEPDGMLVSCVGSAGGRSSAEDEEVATETEADESESPDSPSEEDPKE